ncbi:hypothetical protein CKO09_10690 [Chromatium weissei]|nr:hypothetical protein [Chromatium weissei]
MTYSIDFRTKVLDVKQKQGLTDKEVAELFAIGTATIGRWKTKLEPQRNRNKPPTKINTDLLLKDIADYPDAYLQERATRLQVTKSGIHSALKRLGISRKKHFHTLKLNHR